jgi:hypothetical protein
MSYIGNPITTQAFVTDQFNGSGSQVTYTMSVAPANTASVLVSVSGVLQDPSTYSVSGTTLTFSAAPPAGTGNISCRYLGIPATGITNTAYRTVTEFTATAGQTGFTVPSYTIGFLNVYRNGILLGSADYTANNGVTITLSAGCNAGDLVTTESFQVASVLNGIAASGGGGTNNVFTNPTIAGNGITFPYGTNPQGAPAKVIQVVNASYSTQVSTTSTTFVTTGLSASITPLFSTSKILILYMGVYYNGANNEGIKLQVIRGSTSVWDSNLGYSLYTGATNIVCALPITAIDSPATTSSTTYNINFSAPDGVSTVRAQYNNITSNIILMEIAA